MTALSNRRAAWPLGAHLVRAVRSLVPMALAMSCASYLGAIAPVVATEVVLATAAHVRVGGDAETEFRIDLTRTVPVEITTMVQPYRVVVDLPGVAIQLIQALEPVSGGLVTGAQFLTLPENGARVVIDTAGPVRVIRATFVSKAGESKAGTTVQAPNGVQLLIALARVDSGQSGQAREGASPAHLAPASVKPAVFDEGSHAGSAKATPVIVIDPGHGGIDPGAIGRQHTTEKSVVLAVARELQSALSSGGRYDVRLTRTDDTFIPLDGRVEVSRQAKADLFISLHADAIEDGSLARSIHGASIYTLSEKASDEQARLMADKENAADLVAGIDAATVDGGEGIKGILYDLMNRETAVFSRLLSHSIAEALGKAGGLAREPERAAAFRVLKQAHAPSVLIELGFLSNSEEEQRMTEAWWQKQTARTLAQAVDAYFGQRSVAEVNRGVQPVPGRLPP